MTYIEQLRGDTGCRLENLVEFMDDGDKQRESGNSVIWIRPNAAAAFLAAADIYIYI